MDHKTRRGVSDGVLEALIALEARIEAIEDAVTSGDALPLPPPRRPRRVRSETSIEALETALLVGTMTRRMNLRLGSIERALRYRAPLGLDSGVVLRSSRRLKALEAGAADGPLLKCGASGRTVAATHAPTGFRTN